MGGFLFFYLLLYIGIKIELLLLVLNTIINHKTFKDTSVWPYLTYILKRGDLCGKK